jgi:hypothetical protein
VLGHCDVVTEYLKTASSSRINLYGCECTVMMNIGSRERSVDQDFVGGEVFDDVIAKCGPSKGQDHMGNGSV